MSTQETTPAIIFHYGEDTPEEVIFKCFYTTKVATVLDHINRKYGARYQGLKIREGMIMENDKPVSTYGYRVSAGHV